MRAGPTFLWDEDDDSAQREVWDFDMRFYFRHELEHLLARSPPRLETLHGDFEKGPFTAASREFVVTCRAS